MKRADKARMTEEGFSLIEALVALAILAVAATGLIRAAEAHVDSVRGLELRAAAQWVAEDRLAEFAIPALRNDDKSVEMLGRTWAVTTSYTATADPDLRAAHVAVSAPAARSPTVVLDGFVDVGPAA